MEDARLRILPLGGSWETLGSDRLAGIVPEGLTASSNDWGPDQLSFTMKAEETASRPDLLPFTPVELEIGGVLCWAGFVWQRPSDANGYQVICRGWQYHLDDDRFDRVYVHTRLSDYRDQRTFLTSDLTLFTVAGTVATDVGVAQIGWANGAVIPANGRVGVTLDLGPDSTAKRVVMAWDSNGASALTANVKGTDAEAYGSAGETPISFLLSSGATGTSSGTLTTARRYIHVALEWAAGGTLNLDIWLKIKSIQVFRATAYESGNASILKADTVIKDALAIAPLLNQDASMVTAGTFSIPMYATGGYLTPRAVMESVNTLENYRQKIGGADLKTLVFDAKPSAPLAEVGDWSGAQFSDASVSGEPIFSRAITDGTGPDGGRLVSKRTQTGTLVDRRSFTRSVLTPVQAAMSQAVADRIGDLYLAEHRTAPFAGTLSIVGPGARRVLNGTAIPPYEFLLYAGEKIRLANRVDPDTGGWGRDGRIAGVTYNHDGRSVEIAIDDTPTRFETILSRYALLVGG